MQSSILLAVLAALGWAAGAVLNKALLDHFAAVPLLVLQLSASVTFLVAIVAVQYLRSGQLRSGEPSLRPFQSLLRWGWPGLLEPGAAYAVGLVGLRWTSASNAVMISSLEPAIVLLIAAIAGWERTSKALWGLSAVAIAGCLIVIGLDWHLSFQSLLGDGLLLFSTLCASLYGLMSRAGLDRLSPLPLAIAQQSYGLIGAIALLLAIHLGTPPVAAPPLPSLPWLLLAALSGVLQYACAFWCYLGALQGLSASVAAQFLSLIPVFGVIGAYCFLGEPLSWLQGLGVGLVVLAVSKIARLHHDAGPGLSDLAPAEPS